MDVEDTIEISPQDQFQRYVDAHVERFALKYAVPSVVMDSFISEDMSRIANQLVFGVMHRVYSLGSAEHEIQFHEPATWVDAFKQHYMFRWPWIITRHWKINYRTLSRKVTARALLPGVPVRVGEHTVRFVIHDGDC